MTAAPPATEAPSSRRTSFGKLALVFALGFACGLAAMAIYASMNAFAATRNVADTYQSVSASDPQSPDFVETKMRVLSGPRGGEDVFLLGRIYFAEIEGSGGAYVVGNDSTWNKVRAAKQSPPTSP